MVRGLSTLADCTSVLVVAMKEAAADTSEVHGLPGEERRRGDTDHDDDH